MLTTALFVITLMGCGDHGSDCELIKQESKTWQSRLECENAIPSILLKSANAPYPVTAAECSADSSHVVSLNGISVKPLPAPDIISKPSNPNPEITPVTGAQKTETNTAYPESSLAYTANDGTPIVLRRIKNGFALIRQTTGTIVSATSKGFSGIAKGLKTALSRKHKAQSTDPIKLGQP